MRLLFFPSFNFMSTCECECEWVSVDEFCKKIDEIHLFSEIQKMSKHNMEFYMVNNTGCERRHKWTQQRKKRPKRGEYVQKKG